MKSFLALALAACGLAGCQKPYPAFLDSPEMQQAMVQAVRESNKTWSIGASATNPELELYYKICVGARVVGVEGHIGGQGATGPEGIGPR